jgi:hypothetical protein
MKRRELLKSLTIASAVSVVAPRVWATGDTETEKDVEYLFVQNAKEVSLKDGVLTMKGIAQETLFFSDRPERIVGRETTKEFVDTWAQGTDSFKENPPNAVLSVSHGAKLQDIVVVLKNPSLKGDDLVYDVDVLDGEKTAKGGISSLFIDVIGRPLTPVSIAGGRRRVRRRTRRRVERRD